jgi:hypothetical protein
MLEQAAISYAGDAFPFFQTPLEIPRGSCQNTTLSYSFFFAHNDFPFTHRADRIPMPDQFETLPLREVDSKLWNFLLSKSEAEFETEKARLLEQARSRIEKNIAIKMKVRFDRRGAAAGPNPEDVESAEQILSDTVVALLERLYALRADPQACPVRDFEKFIDALASNAISDSFRRKYKQRASLKNQLYYLLKKTRLGFAIWEMEDRTSLCGYAKWAEEKRRLARNSRYHRLLENPRSLPLSDLAHGGPQGTPNPDLVASIFSYVEGPVEFNDLIRVVAELMGVREDCLESLSDDEEEGGKEIILLSPDPDHSKRIEAVFLIKRIWKEIINLPREHRTALLLNLRFEEESAIELFHLLGVATIEEIARAVEIALPEFAEMWNHLPLPDLEIARLLGCPRQDVINRRSSARRALKRYVEVLQGELFSRAAG